MSMHSGGMGISTSICDQEARMLGAIAGAAQPRDEEVTLGPESTCNRRTWKIVCHSGLCLKFLDFQSSHGRTGK